MTRLGCQTQARRVFRQGNGIKPHFQHTLQFAVAQACVINIRSPFSTWTRPGHRRTRVGAEEAIIPWPLLSVGTSEPVSTQAADTNINPNATMNAMRIQASPRPCTGSGWRWWHRSISRAALIVLVGVPPT